MYMGNEIERCRAAVMAGIFYPDDGEAAANVLRGYGLRRGEGGWARAIMAPHAGWDLSGRVAAAAFGAAGARQVDTVVLLGPIHDGRDQGIFLSDSDFFDTPLGKLTVDAELCDEIASCSTLMELNDLPHLYEHSLDVQLPLVKFCLPDAAILPILIGGNSGAAAEALSRALDLVFAQRRESTLFVVSTNLSRHLVERTSQAQGEEFLRLVSGGDREGLLRGMRDGTLSACGASCAAALLGCGLFADETARIISRTSSRGGTAEDPETVHYAALAID